jgi:hypothetical protein
MRLGSQCPAPPVGEFPVVEELALPAIFAVSASDLPSITWRRVCDVPSVSGPWVRSSSRNCADTLCFCRLLHLHQTKPTDKLLREWAFASESVPAYCQAFG